MKKNRYKLWLALSLWSIGCAYVKADEQVEQKQALAVVGQPLAQNVVQMLEHADNQPLAAHYKQLWQDYQLLRDVWNLSDDLLLHREQQAWTSKLANLEHAAQMASKNASQKLNAWWNSLERNAQYVQLRAGVERALSQLMWKIQQAEGRNAYYPGQEEDWGRVAEEPAMYGAIRATQSGDRMAVPSELELRATHEVPTEPKEPALQERDEPPVGEVERPLPIQPTVEREPIYPIERPEPYYGYGRGYPPYGRRWPVGNHRVTILLTPYAQAYDKARAALAQWMDAYQSRTGYASLRAEEEKAWKAVASMRREPSPQLHAIVEALADLRRDVTAMMKEKSLSQLTQLLTLINSQGQAPVQQIGELVNELPQYLFPAQ